MLCYIEPKHNLYSNLITIAGNEITTHHTIEKYLNKLSITTQYDMIAL